MSRLEEHRDICLNLRESCSPEINRLLFQFVGKIDLDNEALTEERLLEYIKSVAVRSIHTEVHRWHFSQIIQQDCEPVAKFVGRLKAQAALCDFKVTCECNKSVSYSEEMVSQRLTSGVVNPEHQAKVLGEACELDTLKKKVDKLISLETTEDATNKIRMPLSSRANPAKASQYKQDQKQTLVGLNDTRPRVYDNNRIRGRSKKRNQNPTRRCRGCGRYKHAEGKSLERKDCPANGQKCHTCGKDNHFAKVCEKRNTRASFARSGGMRILGDTSGSDSENESDYTTDQSDMEDNSTYHYAAQAQDFCQCHPLGFHG